MAQRAAEGWPNGAPGRPVDASMLPVYRRVLDMHAEGLSLRSVAATLNAEAVPTAKGRTWHASTVRAIVTSETARALAASTSSG
jgi:hypothetical protein